MLYRVSGPSVSLNSSFQEPPRPWERYKASFLASQREFPLAHLSSTYCTGVPTLLKVEPPSVVLRSSPRTSIPMPSLRLTNTRRASGAGAETFIPCQVEPPSLVRNSIALDPGVDPRWPPSVGACAMTPRRFCPRSRGRKPGAASITPPANCALLRGPLEPSRAENGRVMRREGKLVLQGNRWNVWILQAGQAGASRREGAPVALTGSCGRSPNRAQLRSRWRSWPRRPRGPMG
jgi:hypothetical protein